MKLQPDILTELIKPTVDDLEVVRAGQEPTPAFLGRHIVRRVLGNVYRQTYGRVSMSTVVVVVVVVVYSVAQVFWTRR